jgi:hypothetical protein
VSRSLSYHPRFLIVSTSIHADTPKGLADHAESVSSYLFDYGRATDGKRRNTLSQSFFCYLFAASWYKMHLRFCSWQALGFIEMLETYLGEKFAQKVKDYEDSNLTLPEELGPGDRTLATFFIKNKSQLVFSMTDIGKMLPPRQFYHLFEEENQVAIPLMLDKFDEAAKLAGKDGKALYNIEIAAIFHCILYFSFLLVGRTLARLKGYRDKFNKKGNKTFRDYKAAVRAAELPVRFLVYLLSSRAFKLHMGVWTNEGIDIKPVLPIFEKKASYLDFGKNRKILGPSRMGSSSDSLEVEVEVESELIEVREPIC